MPLEIDARERDVLLHALGHPEARKDLYRRHFVTGEDGEDWAVLWQLVGRGMMEARRERMALNGGMTTFLVTEAGAEAVGVSAQQYRAVWGAHA